MLSPVVPSVVSSYSRVGTIDFPGSLVEELSTFSAIIHHTSHVTADTYHANEGLTTNATSIRKRMRNVPVRGETAQSKCATTNVVSVVSCMPLEISAALGRLGPKERYWLESRRVCTDVHSRPRILYYVISEDRNSCTIKHTCARENIYSCTTETTPPERGRAHQHKAVEEGKCGKKERPKIARFSASYCMRRTCPPP